MNNEENTEDINVEEFTELVGVEEIVDDDSGNDINSQKNLLARNAVSIAKHIANTLSDAPQQFAKHMNNNVFPQPMLDPFTAYHITSHMFLCNQESSKNIDRDIIKPIEDSIQTLNELTNDSDNEREVIDDKAKHVFSVLKMSARSAIISAMNELTGVNLSLIIALEMIVIQKTGLKQPNGHLKSEKDLLSDKELFDLALDTINELFSLPDE